MFTLPLETHSSFRAHCITILPQQKLETASHSTIQANAVHWRVLRVMARAADSTVLMNLTMSAWHKISREPKGLLLNRMPHEPLKAVLAIWHYPNISLNLGASQPSTCVYVPNYARIHPSVSEHLQRGDFASATLYLSDEMAHVEEKSFQQLGNSASLTGPFPPPSTL